jgi:homoserine dehydrogenase
MRFSLALIGFGGVNRALVDVIHRKKDALLQMADVELVVVGVSDIRFGSAYWKAGFDLGALAHVPLQDGALAGLPGGSAHASNDKIILGPDVDVVVEATFTNPTDGQPAHEHCRLALEHGKHVVTTNKGPIALAGRELLELAARNGVELKFEGTVMSGTPVIRFAQSALRGCEIRGFRGILNGTSNFVLDRVAQGITMAAAVKEAQLLGYAEVDPTADLEGFDVQLKVIILANLIMGASLRPADILRVGISGLTEDRVREASKRNRCWRLIGQAMRNDHDKIEASVTPQLLEASDPLASIGGALNAITFDTDLLGLVTVSGAGAGRTETAFAVMSDILEIHDGLRKRDTATIAALAGKKGST